MLIEQIKFCQKDETINYLLKMMVNMTITNNNSHTKDEASFKLKPLNCFRAKTKISYDLEQPKPWQTRNLQLTKQ